MELTEEGYLKKNGSNYLPFYYVKDHLGSNRVVLNSAGAIEQVTDYYPFRMSFADNNPRYDESVQKYKYNGKELDREHGLSLYDGGARMYDPAIGRFTTMDPLAEKYYAISPYSYCKNNPINRIDPDGMDDYYLNDDGRIVLAKKTKDKSDNLFDGNGNSINVSDQSLLPQLRDYAQGKNGESGETSNANDAFNVFKFVVDNSSPEWSLKGYSTEGGGTGFLLSTSYDKEGVSSGSGSYDPSKLVFSLHSHPPGDDNLGPSGSVIHVPGSRVYEPGRMGGDLDTYFIHYRRNPDTKHYIYHEGTKGLIYYDHKTGAAGNNQNAKGRSVGIVNSASQMRKKIIVR